MTYGTAYAGRNLVLYVMTRRHLRKAPDISRDPRVALMVPIEHRVLRFLPPATIQLHGRAEILDWTDDPAPTFSEASGCVDVSWRPTRRRNAAATRGSVS